MTRGAAFDDLLVRLRRPPLPVTVPLIRDETLNSYVARLARANCLKESALRQHLTGSRLPSVPISLEVLAQATGHSATALSYAMPELAPESERAAVLRLGDRPSDKEHLSRNVCRACLIRHGVNPRRSPDISIRRHPEDFICRRHRRWVAPDGFPTDRQPDLRDQPEIMRAHGLHGRLIRRHGRFPVSVAFGEAENIMHIWERNGLCQERADQRMIAWTGWSDWRAYVRRGDPRRAAAQYPEVIALARLLASPYWRGLALNGTRGTEINLRFLAEVRRTISQNYVWLTDGYHRAMDGLAHRILDERERRDRVDRFSYTEERDEGMIPLHWD
ncbi:TniQ family protein [Nonomuraea longicatena]|uniref:TniQ domain-containing protein n=1 Tax=Nonomuraea longicatena TaxID=83682 RepID=A0ABP4A3S6_9ACTN